MSEQNGEDGLVVVYEPQRGARRRVAFEPRTDGRYDRIVSVWTGCDWRVTGREVVAIIRRQT